jgi:hypothetical protein
LQQLITMKPSLGITKRTFPDSPSYRIIHRSWKSCTRITSRVQRGMRYTEIEIRGIWR